MRAPDSSPNSPSARLLRLAGLAWLPGPPEEALAQAAQAVARACAAPLAEVLWPQQREGVLRRWGYPGGPEPQAAALDQEALEGVLAAEGPLLLRGPAASLSPWAAQAGACWALAAPLRVGGQVWGLLAAYRTEGRPFSPFQARLLETAARALSLYLERQRERGELESLRRRWQALWDNPYQVVAILSAGGRILEVSPGFLARLGTDPATLVGAMATNFIHPEDVQALARLGQRPHAKMALRWRLPDGQWVWLEAVGAAFQTPEGKWRVLVTVRDLTEHRRLETELRQSEETLRTVLDTVSEAVFITDRSQCYLWCNQAFSRLTGYSRNEAIGLPLATLIPPDQLAKVREISRRQLRGELGTHSYDLEILTKEGQRLPIEVSVSVINRADGSYWFVGSFRDISERRRWEARLLHLADHDHLTGLFNRRRFYEELERELARVRRYGGRAALLWVDLDGFKEINDRFGHHVGDDVLRHVAAALRLEVRRSDFIGRLGGDEFGVVLVEVDEEEAQTVAQRILVRLQDLVLPGGIHLRLSASIGVALLHQLGADAKEAMVYADRAMYASKAQGVGVVTLHRAPARQPITLTAPHKMRGWEVRLRRALQAGHLRLFCQPILNLHTNRVGRYELLLRLQENGHIIPPPLFLWAAEELNLIRDIDHWVVQRTVALLRQLLDSGQQLSLHVDLHVNMSGRSVCDPELRRTLRKLVQEAGLEPGRLVFEITETSSLLDVQEMRAFMEEMRQLGCRFALDDFGVGHSSLYRLRFLPFDYLKIDGSFVRGLLHDRVDRMMVRGFALAASALGLRSIAEQVEDPQLLDVLRELGVDYAQGYCIGRPRPVEQEWPDFKAPEAGAGR
jgi:diguanylate cyclase (GGDEF)-like protein/PAS domain S-box-containing protein